MLGAALQEDSIWHEKMNQLEEDLGAPLAKARAYLKPHLVDLCFYHSGCCDGFAAAMCAHMNLIPFHPLEPSGTLPPELIAGKRVLLVDVALSRENLLDARRHAHSILILDHHLSNWRELEDLPGCCFQMDYCGAVLSWRYFFPQRKVPLFLWYIQDRDLWKWEHVGSRPFCAWFYKNVPFDMQHYLCFVQEPSCYLNLLRGVQQGKKALQQVEQRVAELSKQAVSLRFQDHQVLAVEVDYYDRHLLSELGSELAQEVDYALLYWRNHKSQQYHVSLRASNLRGATGVDCR